MIRLLLMFLCMIFVSVPTFSQVLEGWDTVDKIHTDGYNFMTDHVSTKGIVAPYESASDTTGKTYHYIYGATHRIHGVGFGKIYLGGSSGAAIDARGYKNLSVQVFRSSVGSRTIGGSLIAAPTIELASLGVSGGQAPTLRILSSAYPSGIGMESATGTALTSGRVYGGSTSIGAFSHHPLPNLYSAGRIITATQPGVYLSNEIPINYNGMNTIELIGVASLIVEASKNDLSYTTNEEYLLSKYPDWVKMSGGESTLYTLPISNATHHIILRLDK